MALEPFAKSRSLTFGVELELQLVSLSDFDLTAASPDLLHLLAKKPFPGNVTPEITESMIEINSSVQIGHGPLLAELHEIRNTLVAAADTLNIGICGGGTHPFQHWSEQKIYPKPRFQELSSAACRVTTRCSCSIRYRATCRTLSRCRPRRRSCRGATPCSTRRGSIRCSPFR
jgi:carboxylate-amine ligase